MTSKFDIAMVFGAFDSTSQGTRIQTGYAWSRTKSWTIDSTGRVRNQYQTFYLRAQHARTTELARSANRFFSAPTARVRLRHLNGEINAVNVLSCCLTFVMLFVISAVTFFCQRQRSSDPRLFRPLALGHRCQRC